MIYQFLTTHFGCWFLLLFWVACFLWLACCNFAPSSNFEQVSKNTLLSGAALRTQWNQNVTTTPPPKKKKRNNSKRSTFAKRKVFFLWSLPLEMPWVVPTFPVIFTRIFLEFLRLQRSQFTPSFKPLPSLKLTAPTAKKPVWKMKFILGLGLFPAGSGITGKVGQLKMSNDSSESSPPFNGQVQRRCTRDAPWRDGEWKCGVMRCSSWEGCSHLKTKHRT